MDPKTCNECGESYPRTSEYFYANPSSKDGLYSLCKQCKSSYRKEHRRQTRQTRQQVIREAKNKPCADCKNEYPFYVMDFDHIDPAQKVANVSQMVSQDYPVQQILDEIAKCEVVCSNCHRIRTWSTS